MLRFFLNCCFLNHEVYEQTIYDLNFDVSLDFMVVIEFHLWAQHVPRGRGLLLLLRVLQ